MLLLGTVGLVKDPKASRAGIRKNYAVGEDVEVPMGTGSSSGDGVAQNTAGTLDSNLVCIYSRNIMHNTNSANDSASYHHTHKYGHVF